MKHNYIENDWQLVRHLTFQGLNKFYNKMSTVSHLEPEYKEMMEFTIIQVKLEENKTQKKMGTARGLCSTWQFVLDSHLEPEYKEMMEFTIIQVKLKENKTQKKMGAARGLCSAWQMH